MANILSFSDASRMILIWGMSSLLRIDKQVMCFVFHFLTRAFMRLRPDTLQTRESLHPLVHQMAYPFHRH